MPCVLSNQQFISFLHSCRTELRYLNGLTNGSSPYLQYQPFFVVISTREPFSFLTSLNPRCLTSFCASQSCVLVSYLISPYLYLLVLCFELVFILAAAFGVYTPKVPHYLRFAILEIRTLFAAVSLLLHHIVFALFNNTISFGDSDDLGWSFQITKTIIKPLILHCQHCVERFQVVSVSDPWSNTADTEYAQLSRKAKSLTYSLNCYYLIQSTLARLDIAVDHLEQLAAVMDSSLEGLITVQVSSVLRQTRLIALVQLLEAGHDVSTNGPLSDRSDVDLNEKTILEALTLFDAYLSSPDKFALPELQYLIGQRLKKVVRRRCADEIHSRYQLIYQTITDPANGFASLCGPSGEHFSQIRTPQQVAELILNV